MWKAFITYAYAHINELIDETREVINVSLLNGLLNCPLMN